jgi:hypothetical protein
MSTANILYLALVLCAFAIFLGLVGWVQYYTRDVGRDGAINPQAKSRPGFQTLKNAADSVTVERQKAVATHS